MSVSGSGGAWHYPRHSPRIDTSAPFSRAYNAASPPAAGTATNAMKSTRLRLSAIAAACALVTTSVGTTLATDMSYPPTARRPVVDTYHGVAVTDDYRWLEDDNAPDVKAWVAEQNKFTRAYLDGIAQRPEIAKRVGELLRAKTIRRFGFQFRQRMFAMKFAPPPAK